MKLTGSVVLAACAALLYGCAGTVPNELVNARLAYEHASAGPAARLAPADLHKAQLALDQAEKFYAKDEGSYYARDLAYVAQRKAEMADAQASIVAEQDSKARADANFQVVQGDLLQKKSDDLDRTRTALAVSERNSETTAEQLSAEQKARIEAEKRTTEQRLITQEKTQDLNQTRTALAVSERSGQAQSEQLSAAQQARRDADQRTTEQRLIAEEKTQDLNQTRTALAVSERSGQVQSEQLSVAQQARLVAEQKTAEAQAALVKLAALKEEERGMVITLSGSVLFRSDEAILMPGAETRLDQVVAALTSTDRRNIMVEGYTDSQGSDSYNLDLSQRRADAVRAYIVGRGWDAGQIQARGIGEERPIADNLTAEGRANNRRVEIVLQPAAKQ